MSSSASSASTGTANKQGKGIPIPELGAVFFINSSNEQCIRPYTKEETDDRNRTGVSTQRSGLTGEGTTTRTDRSGSAGGGSPLSSNKEDIQKRASAINWTSDCIPVKDLPQNLQWEIQQYLKEVREGGND